MKSGKLARGFLSLEDLSHSFNKRGNRTKVKQFDGKCQFTNESKDEVLGTTTPPTVRTASLIIGKPFIDATKYYHNGEKETGKSRRHSEASRECNIPYIEVDMRKIEHEEFIWTCVGEPRKCQGRNCADYPRGTLGRHRLSKTPLHAR